MNADRFWSKVDATGDCWEWIGARRKADGYGAFHVAGEGQTDVAHRVVWKLLVGPIPYGLTIDHLCRNRACVNPDHLQVVAHRVNILRGYGPSGIAFRSEACPNGHPYRAETTGLRNGSRSCLICHRAMKNRNQRKRRAAARNGSFAA